eukprot:g2436.t1
MGNSESQVQFRDCILQISKERVSGQKREFWEALWMLPTCTEDIFRLVTPKDVRQIKLLQPENLCVLIRQAVAQLSQVVKTPESEYFEQALNCVRILSRVLPFVFEDESDEFHNRVFWQNLPPLRAKLMKGQQGAPEDVAANVDKSKKDETTATGDTSSDVAATLAAAAATPLPPSFVADEVEKQNEELQKLDGEPLGKQLIHALARMLFLPNFTVGEAAYKIRRKTDVEQTLEDADPVLLWAAGIRTPSATPLERAVYDTNRKEVLRLLMICGSSTLFLSPEKYDPYGNKWLKCLCDGNLPYSATIFTSLLNVICTYNPYSTLPYGGSVLTDYREPLVDSSLHALLVLLDFSPDSDLPVVSVIKSPSDQQVDSKGETEEEDSSISPRSRKKLMETYDTPGAKPGQEKEVVASKLPAELRESKNIFRRLLGKLKGSENFHFLFEGLTTLLNNVPEANNTYMPNSLKAISCQQELIILLWKLLDENRAFMAYVLEYEDVTRILNPLVYFMYAGRNDPAMVPSIHMCTFVLLLLSGERNFGVALNKPFVNGTLPIDLPLFEGNHADLTIVVFHKLIVNGSKKLKTLHSCLLTIISNISPYTKSLSNVASMKILALFEIFASPRFIFRSPGSHQYLLFLIDIFNNLIQYQYEGNLHLIYAIVRRKKRFEALHNLSIPPQEKVNAETKMSANAMATGSKKFQPTKQWLDSWKTRLPLNTVMRVLHYLEPQVKVLCNTDGSIDEAGVLKFLKNTTMVGLLPVPHPIVIRKYQPNEHTMLWFTTFVWGVIFLRNQDLPFFDVKRIKLFSVERCL